MFTDTHAHLNDTAFDSDRGEVIARAGSVDVSSIVEIACAPAEWLPAVQLASAFPGLIRCAFGIHPVCVTDFTLAAMAELETILFQPCAVAVGEMGLDYWWEPDRKEAQLALLETQLELCVRRHKPAVFHVRNGKDPRQNAYSDLLALIDLKWDYVPATRFRGVLHCFSGTWEDAKAGLDLGLALGVNGTFTYKKNGDLRETIKKVGLDHIVLETDCPYLPPQSVRGKRNDPSFIPEIADLVAAYVGVTTTWLTNKTTANAGDLFGRLSGPMTAEPLR